MTMTARPTVTADSDSAMMAALYWSEQITKTSSVDVGDEKANMGITLARAIAPGRGATAAQVEAFEQAFMRLAGEAEAWSVSCGVDYQPSGILATALAEAGISAHDASLPPKTRMTITPKRVEVAAGYGASPRAIYW